MINVRTFKTTDDLIDQAFDLLQKTLPTAGNLMLSGGSTPYVIYNRLAKAPISVSPERTLFLSDERMAPPESPQNNANNLGPMLSALDCEDQFIRIDTTLSASDAAQAFSTALESIELIDLGLLGLGTDGHTAGVFTPEQANPNQTAKTVFTQRPDGMEGVSITPAFFKQVNRLILLVTGEGKREIIQTLLNNPESIPAGIALKGHPWVELWTDLDL